MSSDPLGGLNKPVVSYFFDDEIGNYQFNVGHPMKPFRVKMTDTMIRAYGLDDLMTSMHIEKDYIEKVDFTVYHSDDYIDLLKTVNTENQELYLD